MAITFYTEPCRWLILTLHGALDIFRGGFLGLIMGDPIRLSTPTGDEKNGLWGGGPATGLDASPEGAAAAAKGITVFNSYC